MCNVSNKTDLESLSMRYWVYVAQGLVLVLCNGVIVVAYLFHGVLRDRKELALPAALAFCDATDGLGAVLAGTGRNWMLSHGTGFCLTSRWGCFLMPWNWFWIWTNHIMDPTLVAISVDRLIAVSWPLYHYGLSRSYSKLMVGLAWGPATLLWLYSVYLSYQYQELERPSLCHIEYVFDDTYYKFNKGWRVLLSSASVIIYAVVIGVFFYRGSHDDDEEMTPEVREYQKMQRKVVYGEFYGRTPDDDQRWATTVIEHFYFEKKVTITLGISCIFTTILYVLPQLFRGILPYLIDMQTSGAAAFMSLSYIIENFNKFANIFLYSFRLKNVRMGIMYLFLCKELTEAALKNHNTSRMNTQHPLPAGNHIEMRSRPATTKPAPPAQNRKRSNLEEIEA